MSERPQFSVVITTRDRHRQLAKLLCALTELDFPRDQFEVIVVDDGSSVPFTPAVSSLCLQTLRVNHGGPARGRNTGVRAARGEYLAFIDDDCMPEAGWLRALQDTLLMNPGAMIGGRTRNGLPANPYSSASQFIVDMVYAYYNENPHAGRFFATNNMALPRDRFLAIGAFDEDYLRSAGEDRDLCDRWAQAGFPIVYEPVAVISHVHDLTFASFCRQHFFYGWGAAMFHRKASERRSGRMRDHLGFHRRLPSWFARTWQNHHPRPAIRLIALFLMAQVVTAAGFLYGRLHRRPARIQ